MKTVTLEIEDSKFEQFMTILNSLKSDFAKKLEAKINDLPHFPYKCRQSQKSDDTAIRELIFEGYVIPYRVDKCKIEHSRARYFSKNKWKL